MDDIIRIEVLVMSSNMKGKVVSGLLWKFAERMGAQIVTFVVSIVLARLLTPDDYGTIALVMVFITIANVFAESGFGNALIQKKEADYIDFSSVFYFNIFSSITLYLILFLAAPFIGHFLNNDQLVPVLRVIGIRLIIAGVNSVQKAYISKNMMFKRFFVSTLWGTIGSAIVGIIMAYQGFGIWALVAQYMINTTIDTLVLWFTVKWRPHLVFSGKRMKGLFQYGWKLLFSSLLDTTYNEVRNLIIGKFYTAADLGLYNKGEQYPKLVVTNVNVSISSVLFPAISECQNDIERVRSITRRAIKTSSYVMFPILIGLAVVAKPLVIFMLTEKWVACVPFLQIACLTSALMPIHIANLEAMKAVGRSDLFLKLEIIKKVVLVVILVVVMRRGPMAIALSGIVASVLSSFINAYPNKRLIGYSYIQQVKDIMSPLVLSVMMGIVVYMFGVIDCNVVLKLVIQGSVGVLVYAGLSFITKNDNLQYILNSAKEFKKNRNAVGV